MRVQPRKRLKRYVPMTKSVSGRYHLRLVASGTVGSEMRLNMEDWTRRMPTPSMSDDRESLELDMP